MAKYSCFIIGPIGEVGTEVRTNADDVRDYIIKPVLEPLGFEVHRGDDKKDPNDISKDVVESVEDADLCVIDLSYDERYNGVNPNVMFEFGIRKETGKPFVLLKSKGDYISALDIRNYRFIEYSFSGAQSYRAIEEVKRQVRELVEPYIENGFDEEEAAMSQKTMSMLLRTMDRKLDKLTNEQRNIRPSVSPISTPGGTATGGVGGFDGKSDPRIAFALALRQKDLNTLDQLLDVLYRQNNLNTFIDLYAETAAARGSDKAGQFLLDYGQDFIDSIDMSLKKKYEFIGSLISYLNRKDLEGEKQQFVEGLIQQLFIYMEVHPEEEDTKIKAGLYNQLNRLYNGIYQNDDNISFLEKAYENIQKALSYSSNDKSYLYNCASIEYSFYQTYKDSDPNEANNFLESAAGHIDDCLIYSASEPDEDYLLKAYRIHNARGDVDRANEVLEIMSKEFPQTAQMLMMYGDYFA